MKDSVLVTGGAGFFGSALKRRLLENGMHCVSLDLCQDFDQHPSLTSVQGDVRDRRRLESLFRQYNFSAVFHCAAMLAHDVRDRALLWTTNVNGTEALAHVACSFGRPRIVFISSNCLWAAPFDRPVSEDDPPAPKEIYGRSKWAAEQALMRIAGENVVILRTPTIIGSGRLGLLSILFDFIAENRRVWVVGAGDNRYQFVYAPDLAEACLLALAPAARGVFNVGSDDVPTLRETYQYVIDKAGSGAMVTSLPRQPTLAAMRIAHAAGLSPLGPYQYRMIAESFVFDTRRIKQTLGWRPTSRNGEMLFEAFDYYRTHSTTLREDSGISAHRRPARMGVIRLLKQLS
jgi:nucleoside-diphosphate-sugar epimerase